MRDDGKQNARWTIRLCAALLPISYRGGGESEARVFLAHGSYIDCGQAFDAHCCDANWDVFSAGPDRKQPLQGAFVGFGKIRLPIFSVDVQCE